MVRAGRLSDHLLDNYQNPDSTERAGRSGFHVGDCAEPADRPRSGPPATLASSTTTGAISRRTMRRLGSGMRRPPQPAAPKPWPISALFTRTDKAWSRTMHRRGSGMRRPPPPATRHPCSTSASCTQAGMGWRRTMPWPSTGTRRRQLGVHSQQRIGLSPLQRQQAL